MNFEYFNFAMKPQISPEFLAFIGTSKLRGTPLLAKIFSTIIGPY